ncbi:LOW QUALITY PROTEIN: cilia- and flagella-associated protein 46-like [Dendronephthya gigantea]|uniref:LOW QUALITY PROTEIN: cilia- and flagella-associated protein 46-like n=1 Tax=Dendronephthya gigantea TaxID=151771 RepID=UPI00106D6E78|nr:LOW QUALITY PROTEIN: cilia- and flagella-associated protein 46-like [Dendronephthya gigantea]
MDSSIRSLLYNCRGDDEPKSLIKPYEKLKQLCTGDAKVNVGTDLFVLCAEIACLHKKFEMAEDCIKMYFANSPPGNQFLCRAYMCQALIQAPSTTMNPEQIDKAFLYILKAINFAKQNSRYYFLIYNASVLYWQFCRIFLKPNYKRFVAKSLHQVVKALDDIDDADYEWRAQLMISLIECHIDAGRKDDASQVAFTAAQFTKTNVPNLYKNVLGLQIQYRLAEYGKLSKETKSSPDVHLFFKIHRLKVQLAEDDKADVAIDFSKFYKQLTGQSGSDVSRNSTEFSEKSSPSASKTSTPVAMESSDRLSLILELAKLCMSYGASHLAADCLDYLQRESKEPSVKLIVEFLRCELMVKSLGDKQENYSQSIVQIRLQAIEKLEQYLMTALRLGDQHVIEVGCTTMWNLCLPLLQFNLRHHVRKPLKIIADTLESVDSLNSLLRCQIHTELAKCEEGQEQVEQAMIHLKKAMMLDDNGLYTERLGTSLTRLQLRASLYKTPERPEDVAAMIIEQARSSSDSGTSRMKRASLVKAGDALAPDAFIVVLEGESKDLSSHGKQPPSLLSKLAAKAERFEVAVGKAAGHLKRLGTHNDQERVRIWADLTKTARKQQIWDVARVAARFCLLYDDERWSLKRETKQTGEDEGGYMEEDRGTERRSSSGGGSLKKGEGQLKRSSYVNDEAKYNVEKDLLRILAEVHFINAEALIQYLKSQSVAFCDKPTFPTSEVISPQESAMATEDSPQWMIYCDWISSLSQTAISEFQRASALGSDLQEKWLVCNSAVYLLNYTTHLVAQKRHRELVPILTSVFKNMRNVGHVGEGSLMCHISNILATGLMQPWYPVSGSKTSISGSPSKKADGKKDKAAVKVAPKVTTGGFDSDAIAELKQALEYLDYALQVTNGNDTRNLVPISVRHSVIKTWVHCKQLLSQQIPKNYGFDSDDVNSQGPMSRCLCAVEMLSVNLYGLSDFSSSPTIQEVVRMAGNCIWSDDAVALEIWSRLAVLSFNADNHQLVMECGQKALAFELQHNKKEKGKLKLSSENNEKSKQYLLYYSCVIMGQSIVRVMKGQVKMRRDALGYFVKACRFGELAKSYEFVITAARHYWNTVMPLVNQPLERQLLKEPLQIVLRCLAAVSEKNIEKGDEEDDEDEESEEKAETSVKEKKKKDKKETVKKSGMKTDQKTKPAKKSKASEETIKKKTSSLVAVVEPVNVYEDDLKMRAAMYGVLFEAFADQSQWEEGLRTMDEAVRDMPRTSHRLLIFKHRVITKAKLGRDVQFDMGKFKNESELVISTLWHLVALNSCDPREQLKAYQKAIDALKEDKSVWQKVDFLLEFGEWLFVNEFPVQDALDQFIEAVDILLNRSDNTEPSDHDDVESEHPSRSSSGLSSKNGTHFCQISDVKTLEYLMRIYIMLSQLVGRKSSQFTDYSLCAVACVQRIWKLSLDFSETSRDVAKAGDSTPTKKGNKTKEQKEVKGEKSSGKTSLPTTLHNWATFELPEKCVEIFKNDEHGNVISNISFARPAISVHYLNILLDNLSSIGYHHTCLSITSLLRCLAKHVIENESLLKYIHWRTMEVCQELHLMESAMHHERIAKDFENQKDEIAKSKEEIELWKEKQRQVKTEEMNSNLKTLGSTDERRKISEQLTAQENNNWMTGRQKLLRIERREIWIQQAAILIRQGYYQSARELLNEANSSALAFNDNKIRAEVLYHLALLAYQESNWEQSITLLHELQNFRVDQKFWLKSVLLLADAICEKKDKHDPLGICVDKQSKKKAMRVLKQATATFKCLYEDSPNKACMAEYVLAKLQAKLGSVCAKKVVDETNETSYLVEACEHLRSSEKSLQSCGYRQEAIDVRCERAAMLRQMAANSKTKADKRNLYLEALTLLRSTIRSCDVLSTEVSSHCSPEELSSVSLAVERTSVESKLCFGQLAVEIMNEHAVDERSRRNKDARKSSVEKLIDAFVQDEPTMTEQEKQWSAVTKTIVDETLVHMTTAFHHCSSVPYLKAKCYLVLGQCLRIISCLLNPDDEPQWNIHQIPPVQMTGQTVHPTSVDDDDDENDPDDELEQNSNHFKTSSKRANVADLLKLEYKDFQRATTQAVECLTHCVQLSLKYGFNEIASESSYLLMDIIGRHDSSTSSLYLALYQSCSMAQTLHSLVKRIQTDSSLSRLAALMKQRDILARKFLHQEAISSVLASTAQTLGEFEAWRRLSVSKSHLDFVKELSSPNTLYLVLQHSKDRSCLYAATLDKPRSGLPSAKPGKQAALNPVSAPKPLICRSKVDADDLKQLLNMMETFRSDQAAELIRQTYLRRHVVETQSILDNVDEGSLNKSEDVLQNDSSVLNNEERLQKQYLSLVSALESYLSPVMEQLLPALDEKLLPETVVILADENLLRLPLESLSVFKSSQVQCLARDLSLQMHFHRFHSTDNSGSESKNEVKKPAGGKKAGKGDAPTTAKSQDKKGEKKASKEQGIPKEGIAVDISALRYIVDPYNECSSYGNYNPEKVINDLISKYRTLSSKWTGVAGTSHIPSIGEWQKFLKESSVFLFYGTEKCLNYLPPKLLLASSLQECNIMLLLDHVETNDSFLRQASLDAQKTCSEINLELSFESVAILSLTGVNSAIANQWSCKLKENKEKLVQILEVSIDENKNIGNALRMFGDAKPDISVDPDTSTAPPSTEQPTVIVADNTVLYGLPYFMLNPLK